MITLSFDTFEGLIAYLTENIKAIQQFSVLYGVDPDHSEEGPKWGLSLPNEAYREIITDGGRED